MLRNLGQYFFADIYYKIHSNNKGHLSKDDLYTLIYSCFHLNLYLP